MLPKRITTLLKRQQGKCHYCELLFVKEDLMEIHHHDGDRTNQVYDNLRLLYRHCHDSTHRNNNQKNEIISANDACGNIDCIAQYS